MVHCGPDRTRRELATSLALARPDSPARGPILAHLAATDAGLAARRRRRTLPRRQDVSRER